MVSTEVTLGAPGRISHSVGGESFVAEASNRDFRDGFVGGNSHLTKISPGAVKARG